jgi:hypothetical protein
MAKVSIYIRTYKRDIAWLDFCLQSIHRNLKGWDEIVLCIPEGQEHHLRFAEGVRVVTSPVYPNDYIGQQVSKLLCHRHVTGDLVLIVDSDLIFLPGASVYDYIEGGRPRILTCNWPNPPDTATRRWKPVVTKLFGEVPPCSFMQGHGARLFHKSSLVSFSQQFPDIEKYARRQPRNQFSEFQFLGFFIYKNERTAYSWTELTATPLPDYHTRQYWNADGITPEVLTEMSREGLYPRWPSTLSPVDRFKQWLSQTTRRIKQKLKSIGVVRS